jgi:hypothetical protein
MAVLTDAILRGEIGDRPAAGSAGRLYISTDENKLYRDNGVSWDEIVISITPAAIEYPGICQGRLSLETGVPISTTDQTAKAILYFTPYKGNKIGTYSGSVWTINTFTEKSLSLVELSTATNYDIFIVDSTLVLEAVAWTNDTTRATALVLQDGVYVKSGAATRRYLGTIRCSASGQCEDSALKRFVWNCYHRVTRTMRVTSGAAHAYTTGAWRAWNNDTANRMAYVIGLSEDAAQANILSGSDHGVYTGLCRDNTNSGELAGVSIATTTEWQVGHSAAFLPALGYHYIQCTEYGVANGNNNYVDATILLVM